jgi:hypothetical protein
VFWHDTLSPPYADYQARTAVKLRGNYQRPVVLHANIGPGLPKRGLNGIMRSTIAACAILVLLMGTSSHS